MSNIHSIDDPRQHDIRIIESTVAATASRVNAASAIAVDRILSSSQNIKTEPTGLYIYHVNAVPMHHPQQHHHQHQHQQQQQLQNQLQQQLFSTTSLQPTSSAYFAYPSAPLPLPQPVPPITVLAYSSRYHPKNLSDDYGSLTLTSSTSNPADNNSSACHFPVCSNSSTPLLSFVQSTGHRSAQALRHYGHDATASGSDVPVLLHQPKVEPIEKHTSPLAHKTPMDATMSSGSSGSGSDRSADRPDVGQPAALLAVQTSSSPDTWTSSHQHRNHHHQNQQLPSTSSGSGSGSVNSIAFAQPSEEPDSDDEELDQDEDADGEESSGSQSKEVSCDFERSPVDFHVKEHVDKITEELNKLRLRMAKQHQQIKKLRVDNTYKGKEIEQIKDLNIKLQLELEKYRSSDGYNSSFTYCADREAKVTFPDGITLTAYNLKDLECCEIGEKGDSAFILKLLLALYTREELRMKSITGKPSRNKKYVQDTPEKFSPQKLQFIKEKFRERVSRENTLPTERENRCRGERVHKIINTKIQNLKRKKNDF